MVKADAAAGKKRVKYAGGCLSLFWRKPVFEHGQQAYFEVICYTSSSGVVRYF
jgi:hypothetical protein